MDYTKEIKTLEAIAQRAEARGDTQTYEAAQRCIAEAYRADLENLWRGVCPNSQAS